MIGEDAKHYATDDPTSQCQYGHQCGDLHKIRNMLHSCKVVFNICHEQGKTKHDRGTRQEDDDEVVRVPRSMPAMRKPAGESGEELLSCLLRGAFFIGLFIHIENGD